MDKQKKNRKYKSNKLIIVLSIVFAALLVAAIIIVYCVFLPKAEDSKVETTQVSTVSTTISQVPSTKVTDNSIADSVETEPTNAIQEETQSPETSSNSQINTVQSVTTSELKIEGSYSPYKAIESETGKEVQLTTVFGKSYKQYGGQLTLSEDDTFIVYVGISNSEDSTGKYERNGNELNATYTSGKTSTFVLSETADGELEVIVPMGLYNIYFK